ncbi:MAG: hypothetical protein R3C68_18135 [Myxococcota bacterium]
MAQIVRPHRLEPISFAALTGILGFLVVAIALPAQAGNSVQSGS